MTCCGIRRHCVAAAIACAIGLVGAVAHADEEAADGNLSGSLVFDIDRDASEVFELAEQEISTGQVAAGLRRLQQLLDRADDRLIAHKGTIGSAWEAANRLIAHLPDADRQTYERQSQPAAQRDFDVARNPPDVALLMRLRDRFRHTTAGRQAAVLLAALAYDRGEHSAAAEAAQFLTQHYEADSLPPGLNRWIAPDVPATVADPSPRGDRTGWRRELQVAETASRAINAAVAELDAQALTPILTCRPVVADGRIVTRTLRGLLCVEAATGKVLWEQRIDSYAGRLAGGPGAVNDPIRAGQVSAALLRRLVRDSLQDELSSDGRTVYTVLTDERQVARDPEHPANRLRAVDMVTGQVRWEAGPGTSDEKPRRRSGRKAEDEWRFFLGPPLIDGDQLLLPAQRDQSVELVALDRGSGTPLWSVAIGRAVRDLWPRDQPGLETPPEDRERQSTACRISRRGSRVLIPTGAGAVGCVDTLLRRLVWVHRYPRRDLSGRAPKAGDETYFREMPIRDAFVTAESWIDSDVGICALPGADRLLAFSISDGQLRWSRPRGDALQVLATGEGQLLLVGESGVRSLAVANGTQQWMTSTRRPVGRGTIVRQQLLVPVADDELERLQCADGTLLEAAGEVTALPGITIAAHPPQWSRPVELRNLSSNQGVLVSQSATRLQQVNLQESAESPPTTWQTTFAADLGRLLRWRHAAAVLIDPARQIDSRLLLTDGLLLGLFERAGLKPSIEQQARQLVERIEQASSTDDRRSIEEAQRQLVTLHPRQLYVTTADGRHSCRLDRWLDDLPLEPDRAESQPADTPAPPSWPDVVPRVLERQSNLGISYLHRVPIQDSPDSVWRGVTVETDRMGKMVQFSAAGQPKPIVILLPPEVGTYRLDPTFLQGWARGRMLLLRVGMELIAFEHPGGADLPTASLWPPKGETLSLLGTLAGRPAALQESDPLPWDTTSSGFEDVFGRGLGDVGPVRADYFCHLQRGDVIARETRSGRELWRRTRWPVGTRAIGDDAAVVLFHASRPQVTVLDARDGRTLGGWRRDQLPDPAAAPLPQPFRPRLISGTRALLAETSADRLLLRTIDMTGGNILWSRDIPAGAIVFEIDDRQLGVAVPASANRPFSISVLDWQTGLGDRVYEVDGPEELQDVLTFTDARRRYVILSGPITDLPLQNVRQIRDGLDRPVVNGWLIAFDLDTAEWLWSQPLDNVAFPLVQPRHVPLLVVNDMVQPADTHTPQGRLNCLDARTGASLLSLMDPTHIYYTLDPDLQQSRIELRTRRRAFHIDYGEDEPDSQPQNSEAEPGVVEE